jgi:hypothetical protein
MQAVIEVEELHQDWKPPFAKKRETKSVTVEEGESFDALRDGTPLFTIQTIQGNKVLLLYNRMYSLKGYEHPTERKLWLTMHEPKKFSSLWEDNGVTKTITLRSVQGAPMPGSEMASSGLASNPDITADTEIYRP